MDTGEPSFLGKLSTAVHAFWRCLGSRGFAARIRPLLEAQGSESHEDKSVGLFAGSEPAAALQLLGLLQQQGRFVDFLEQDVNAFSDQEIGAAARVIHQGCREVLEQYLTVQPIHADSEGSTVQVDPGFDPVMIRLTGNVVGEAPFTGTLVHRGWKVSGMELPRVATGHDLSILASAEVEL